MTNIPAPDTDAVAARLSQIGDDPTWPMPLRLAAKFAAAGDPLHQISPASLNDEDMRAALVENMAWRRDQPAAVDEVPTVAPTIMIEPGVAVPAAYRHAYVDRVPFSKVQPEQSEPCPRCEKQEFEHVWQVYTAGEIIDCSEKVWDELYEVTAEYLLNDDVRERFEVAYWPGLPGEDGYWAVEKGNVEANPHRVRWLRVESAERGGSISDLTVVWVADGREYQATATYPIVIREVTQ